MKSRSQALNEYRGFVRDKNKKERTYHKNLICFLCRPIPKADYSESTYY